jgi:PAS domain S-box-containing protein
MMRLETMFPRWVHRLGYYGLALFFVAAAAALRWALPEVLGSAPFLAFYLAWVGAAAFGGLGPGLLATVASWLCLEVLFNFTPSETIFSDPHELGRFVVLMAGGLTVSLVAERMRRGRIYERQQAEELRTANEKLRESEQALHDAEERLRLAMESGKVGVWEWEVRTKDAKWSQGVYLLLGCKPGEVPPTQEALRQRIHPQDLARQDQALKDSLERCEDYLCEFRVVWADGSVHWIQARGQYAYVDEGSGTILRMRGVLSDIDRRKRAEEAIQQANEQLQQQAEELQTQTEELQTQTEELRTQAEELRASKEVLRDLNATLESKVAQRTAQLQWRAQQLQKLTLEVSRTEDRERKRMAEILHDDLQQIIAGAKFHLSLLRNRVKYDASLQAIAAQIDGMLKDAIEKSRGLSHELSPAILYYDDFTETLGWLANQMQAKHGLVVHVHAHGPSHVPSDAIKTFLYKTAQELLFNVVKHARVKEARIHVRRHGPCVCLSVSDRGRGFDPQELRETAGFGLLSIRERIELLGGRMKIRSAEGKGSTFFIAVPEGEQVVVPPLSGVTATQPGASGSQTRSSAFGVPAGPQAQNRLRVLLADDHKIVREGLRSLLSDEPDVEIVGEAAHGREAVDLALRLEPDVVIMDVSMPLIDGDVATRQIKEHLPKMRVVALSTYNEPETIEKMYKAGAESYVLKTASSEELLAAIRGPEPDAEPPAGSHTGCD